MSLERSKADWDDLAGIDPLWAILSDPERQHSRWELDDFFATGDAEIAEILRLASATGYPLQWERALDFGCGVGRLTRALGTHFEEVWGVDISERMVEQARTLNADRPNCRFLVNVAPDLGCFDADSFDFVFSSIVLQHVPSSRLIRSYIAEFLRIVRPGGLVVFQLPYFIPWRNRLQLRRRLYSLLRLLGVDQRVLYEHAGLNPIRMNFMPEREVRALVAECGGVVARVEPDDDLGQPIRSFHYFVHMQQGSRADGGVR